MGNLSYVYAYEGVTNTSHEISEESRDDSIVTELNGVEEQTKEDSSMEVQETNYTIGQNITATLDDDGTLFINGNGRMYSYYSSTAVPWYSNRNKIKEVIIENGITSITAYIFGYCSKLEKIKVPRSVTTIDALAFYNDSFCDICMVCSEKSYAYSYAISKNMKTRKTLDEIYLDDSSITIQKREKKYLHYSVSPNNVSYIDSEVKWLSSDDSIVTVSDNGVITGISSGEATITIYSDYENDVYDECRVTVTNSEIENPVREFTINKENLCLGKGNTFQIVGTVSPYNATNSEILYYSDDESIAKVSDSGLITGVDAGYATISVVCGGINRECSVEVSEFPWIMENGILHISYVGDIDELDISSTPWEDTDEAADVEEIYIDSGMLSIPSWLLLDLPNFKKLHISETVEKINLNTDSENFECIEVDPNNASFCSNEGILYDKSKKTLISCPPNCIKSVEYSVPNGI